MRIGIDVSQLAYPRTGVANYLSGLISEMINIDRENEYVLFYSSFRRKVDLKFLNLDKHKNVSVRSVVIPPTVLSILWNQLHVIPVESFIGPVDVFITSDWTEPPVRKAKKATILYDLIVYLYPDETDKKIVETQKKKLGWVKKESAMIWAISESTRDDAVKVLGVEKEKISVIYPGL